MRKALSLLAAALFVLAQAKVAAQSSGLQVQSLYNRDAAVAGFLIPLRLNGFAQPSDIVTYKVLDFSRECGLMQDPYRTEIFLLKCDRPASPRVEILVNDNGSLKRVLYGPVAVTGADGTAAPPPMATPTPTPPPTGGAAGKAVFNSYCLTSCHLSATTMGAPSAVLIKDKLNGVPAMRAFKAVLSESDIQNLVTYLANPSAY